ncbi:MAG: hypothetical protein S4CHLAM45_00550 [Chlamydiales bacterium]|nr:hypothetical protein [Chlamydiales bacterium]MCH9619377.1 hypothetical protein [Chlamydiales bacterium]MCH9622181.1 hypothetical protein [Chlamydiales bacterium]
MLIASGGLTAVVTVVIALLASSGAGPLPLAFSGVLGGLSSSVFVGAIITHFRRQKPLDQTEKVVDKAVTSERVEPTQSLPNFRNLPPASQEIGSAIQELMRAVLPQASSDDIEAVAVALRADFIEPILPDLWDFFTKEKLLEWSGSLKQNLDQCKAFQNGCKSKVLRLTPNFLIRKALKLDLANYPNLLQELDTLMRLIPLLIKGITNKNSAFSQKLFALRAKVLTPLETTLNQRVDGMSQAEFLRLACILFYMAEQHFKET